MGHCVDSLCNVQEWYEPHKNALMLLLVSVTRDEKGSTPLLVLWEKKWWTQICRFQMQLHHTCCQYCQLWGADQWIPAAAAVINGTSMWIFGCCQHDKLQSLLKSIAQTHKYAKAAHAIIIYGWKTPQADTYRRTQCNSSMWAASTAAYSKLTPLGIKQHIFTS